MNRASFGKRFLAVLVDTVILFVVNGILAAVLGQSAGRSLGFLAGLAYFIGQEGTSGQTVGKKLLNIKVVKVDGGELTIVGALLRYVGRIVSAIPLLLGYFWMLWDAEKQTWHDKIASSYVVEV